MAKLIAFLADAGCDGATLQLNTFSQDYSGIVSGGVPVGGTCSFSQQCAAFPDGGTPYCSVGQFGCGTGTCDYTGSANLGESCLSANCTQGYCDYTDVPDGGAICAPFVGLDAGCPQGDECDPTASNCDSSDTCFLGRCLPYNANLGDSRGNDPSNFGGRYCTTGFCDNPDSGPGTCVNYGGLHDTCAGDDAGSGSCVYDYACIGGRCVQRVRAGNACQSSYDCQNFEACANGTCVAQVAIGDACSASVADQCLDSVCSAGTCQTLALGEVCDVSAAGQENNGGCEPDLSCGYNADGGGTCQYTCFVGGKPPRPGAR